jgi:hypothetical protein
VIGAIMSATDTQFSSGVIRSPIKPLTALWETKVMGERKRRTAELLRRQREAFVKKFGREPGPDDPLIFDPDLDSPVALSKEKLRTQTLEVMRAAGSPPHLVFAYVKTVSRLGRLTAGSIEPGNAKSVIADYLLCRTKELSPHFMTAT